jgi:hypothetical protein
VTRLWVGQYKVQFLAGTRDFSLLKNVQTDCCPSTLLFNEYWRSFPALKWLGSEIDHSPSSTVRLKNVWSYTSTSPYMPSWNGQGQLYRVGQNLLESNKTLRKYIKPQ